MPSQVITPVIRFRVTPCYAAAFRYAATAQVYDYFHTISPPTDIFFAPLLRVIARLFAITDMPSTREQSTSNNENNNIITHITLPPCCRAERCYYRRGATRDAAIAYFAATTLCEMRLSR